MPINAHIQVFDSGLIGEGILHLLAAVQHKLLASDAIMVPSSATVYCQLIQVRVGRMHEHENPSHPCVLPHPLPPARADACG